MDLYAAMRTTGAVRQFTDDPLPDEALERILDHARFAPTGGNRQGVRVIVIREHATRAALAELSLPGARRYVAQQQHGEGPWSPVHPTALSEGQLASAEVPAAMTAPLFDAAVVLVICVDLSVVAAIDQELPRVGLVAGASVYPFAWSVLLAARNEGFGGVLTTMAVAEESRVKQLLGIPERYAVAAVLPLGKPRHQVRRLTRKPVSALATRERFDGASL
ncbi:nitroreductase family protein [Mycobacterium sp. SMC-4]|uniref:nitroreductase family protein n=1 Tax=Mycobacterium sp. SMC-4 TaxID=2857059 RepID=UPI0021B19BE9|nr:nitroreductase family protein [Mycobacterium sp. SMC-4]UXA16859.1 nitroreductase family protein [Mycobacterium sp. SMC-4]